jgi:WD40 repeat protein/regulator of sirC expression with transglutaminase-like and TPR domain
MTERLHPNARLHLADRLSEQVEKASGEDLLTEAAQDFGDRRALAKEFDRALARAVAQERNRRFGDRLAELALHLLTPSWSHLMGAVALAVVVIAGALYLMERSRLGPDHPEVAIARQSLEKLLAERAQERESTAERQAAAQRQATEAAERLRVASVDGKETCNRSLDLDLAIKACSDLIGQASSDASAYRQRGQAYSGIGDYDRAIVDLDQAIRLVPTGALSYAVRGAAYWQKGDLDGAIADANEAIRLASRDAAGRAALAVGYRVRGFAFAGRGDADRAIADFNEALRLAPEDLDYSGRGFVYYRQGSYERAIADFNDAIRLQPGSITAYAWRGEVYEATGDRAKSAEDYNKALSLFARTKWERDRQAEARARLEALTGAQVSTPVNVQMLAVLAGQAGPLESCAFSPDGRRIVTAARHTLRIWDVHSGFVIHEFKGANQRLAWVGFGPDNQVVATYADRSILTWGAAGEITAASLAPRRSVGRSLVLGPNDREVVARDDNTVRLFERGREIAALHGHQGPVTTAVANADGTRILTASDDRTTRIWDTRTGQQLSILRGGDTSVASAAFSPDASRVVTTDRRDANVYVWDAASGAQTAVLRGHSAPVVHAAFSPDGRRLITASDDGTARLWDAERAGAIAVLEGHAGPVTSAAFSPDGRLVATTSQDGTARLWRVSPNGR